MQLSGIQPRRSKLPRTSTELDEILRSPDTVVPPSERDVYEFKVAAYGDIKMYEGYIEQLRSKVSLIKREISHFDSLRSPIRKVPSEVLREFFRVASYENYFGFDDTWDSPAFDIAAVCSRWRKIATTTPELWSSLSIYIYDRAAEAVKLALIRSQKFPLSLELEASDNEFNMTLLPLLFQHRDRWKHLNIGGLLYENGVLSTLTSYPAFLPLIESTIAEGKRNVWLTEVISNAPKLRHLEITLDMHSEERAPVEEYGLGLLHHLEVEYDIRNRIDDELAVLKAAPNLRSFYFYGKACDSNGYYRSIIQKAHEPDLSHITSPITAIRLLFRDSQGVYSMLSDIFLLLTLPSLTSLQIHGQLIDDQDELEYYHNWPHHAVTSCIVRSGCNLTKLWLLGMAIKDTEIIRLLRYTPALEEFTIHELCADHETELEEVGRVPLKKTVTTKLLEELKVTDGEHPFIPKLRYLELRVQSHFNSDKAFVEMVQSRWSLVNLELWPEMERLRTATLVVVNRELDKEEYEPLRDLDRAGMMVSVLANEVYVV